MDCLIVDGVYFFVFSLDEKMKPDAMSQYEEEEPALESHKEQLEEWEEDRCVICGSKCHIVRRSDSDGSSKSDGQFPADELLTLMDTVLDEPPENVTLCVACSFRVGRLQTFQEELARLQLSVTELQREIASSIIVTDGKNDENDVRASLCKRKSYLIHRKTLSKFLW